MKTTIDALVEALRPIAEHGEISAKIIADARAALAQARAEQAEPSRFGSPELQAAILANLASPAAPVAKLEPLSEREIFAARDRAEYEWNAQADYWNQWCDLDADEKQVLIARAVEAAHNAKLSK